jgi:hypothetical protein
VGKALAMHMTQPFEHLGNDDTNIRFGNEPGFVHELLEIAEGEVFHGDKHVSIGIVPSYELDKTFGVLL